jgi:hypothetical protein
MLHIVGFYVNYTMMHARIQEHLEWLLYIDYSKVSLRAVLLHDGNKQPSVSLAHAPNVKEFYENMKLLLEKIQREKYNWNLCGDLKVIALLVGLQFTLHKVFFSL